MKFLNKAVFLLISIFLAFPSIAEKKDAPLNVDGATTIAASEAKALFDEGALFIDPRRDSDWAEGRIPDAIHLELNTVFSEQTLAAEAKKSDAIIFYCNGAKCGRSAKCAAKAVSWGYQNVYYFRGGLPAWKSASYPVE